MAKESMKQQVAVKITPHDRHYLTDLDWLQGNVSALCYDLDSVVFQSQPSEPHWEKISHMIHPWSADVMIDLRQYSFKKDKLSLKSPYSGQKYYIQWMDWLTQAINESNYYWIMPNESSLNSYVVEWLNQLPNEKMVHANPMIALPSCWLSIEESTQNAIQSRDCQHTWFLTENLTTKTADGWVLDGIDAYQISDSLWRNSTELLAQNCSCEACDLGLTRSYFHHLQPSVPLLANRYLTLHNLCQLKFYT